MKVLVLCSYPAESAATRLRVLQHTDELARRGIELETRPFIDAATFAQLYDRSAWLSTARRLGIAGLRRAGDVVRARSVDVVLVQREAMLFGPPLIEQLCSVFGKVPIVLDLDDATYVSYVSPTYGRLGQLLKWPGKADWLIRHATLVTCGNPVIADHVAALGTPARLVPTVVDTERYAPASGRANEEGPPMLGWVGSYSTYPYLAELFPTLAKLASEVPFRLVVVGAGQPVPSIPGVFIESREWRLDREISDFQSFDVGLYPIGDGSWAAGKSGLKAIEYMSVGVPYVATPVGGAADLGDPGVTHLFASTPEEWHEALGDLLRDPVRRREMGEEGRRHVLRNYTVAQVVDELAAALFEAAGGCCLVDSDLRTDAVVRSEPKSS